MLLNGKNVFGAARRLSLCSCLFVLGVTQAVAQAQTTSSVLRAETTDGNVLMLPGQEVDTGEVFDIDGVRMTFTDEGEFRVIRAMHKGKEHKLYVATEGRPRWLAFDTDRGRIRDVLSSLRVELSDYGQLDEIVQVAGGVGGKAFETLGFAIVQLPLDVNPAEVAAKIRSHSGVKRANIQLEGPIRVPM